MGLFLKLKAWEETSRPVCSSFLIWQGQPLCIFCFFGRWRGVGEGRVSGPWNRTFDYQLFLPDALFQRQHHNAIWAMPLVHPLCLFFFWVKRTLYDFYLHRFCNFYGSIDSVKLLGFSILGSRWDLTIRIAPTGGKKKKKNLRVRSKHWLTLSASFHIDF